MKKETFTVDDLREAYNAGRLFGEHNSYFDKPLDENEWIEMYTKEPEPELEETIPVTLALIKKVCGWSEFCDVTGGNHYALKEFSISDREVFDVKISHAKKLCLI